MSSFLEEELKNSEQLQDKFAYQILVNNTPGIKLVTTFDDKGKVMKVEKETTKDVVEDIADSKKESPQDQI